MTTPRNEQQQNTTINDDLNTNGDEGKKKGSWSPEAKYVNALKRADKKGLHVMGPGTLKPGAFGDADVRGWEVYAVQSQTKLNLWHLVAFTGQVFICDCPASEKGVYCVHRAVSRRRAIEVGKAREEKAIKKWEGDAQVRAEEHLARRLTRAYTEQQQQQDQQPQPQQPLPAVEEAEAGAGAVEDVMEEEMPQHASAEVTPPHPSTQRSREEKDEELRAWWDEQVLAAEEQSLEDLIRTIAQDELNQRGS